MTLISLISRISTLALVLSFLAVFPAMAQGLEASSETIKTDHTTLRLVAAARGVGDAESLILGLHFTLQPGWKVYWRSPGDAGYPPSIDWAGSENIAATTMQWPVPHRFSVLGLESLGYKDEVVYPIILTPTNPGQPVNIRANVDYLTCSEICVPYQAKLTLKLPAGPADPSSFAHLINRFAVQVPGDGAAHGLSLDKLEVLGLGKDALLRVSVSAKTPFVNPDAFFEGPDMLAFDKPKVRLTNNGLGAVLTAKVYGAEDLTPPGRLLGLNIGVTLNDGKRAAFRSLSVAQGAGGAAAADDLSFALILALALLGGLILNLMPCVLPVLSIKLLSIVGHGGAEKRQVQASFIASAAGIVFTFLILAAALAALKSAGMTVGWGIQFQQPWFLIAMILIITLFACNLWGLYEFRLPGWLGDMGTRSARVHGVSGDFLTGCFATLLATPCSAPFLGTAIGFALARQPGDIFAVFAAMGLGLAAPYLLIALFPGLATRLPKPGPWMATLRKVMGFALAATGLWLVSVLASVIGLTGGAVVGLLMICVIAVVFLGSRMARLLQIGGTGVVLMALLAFAAPTFITDGTGARMLDKDPRFTGLWQPLDVAAIPALVAQGKTVFVDVTAEWCLTCQVNKAFVLAKEDMIARLGADNVVAMQADWTQPDDAISAYLATFGRYGIPFNAVYGPGSPGGQALPELLTRDIVIEALDKASPNK